MMMPSGSVLLLSSRVIAVTLCLPVLRRASVMNLPTFPPAWRCQWVVMKEQKETDADYGYILDVV